MSNNLENPHPQSLRRMRAPVHVTCRRAMTCLLLALACPYPTAADEIRAAAAVNGKTFGTVKPVSVVGDGTGLSVAAAKVFNPVKDPKSISKTVGNGKTVAEQRVPNPTEDKRLNAALEALAGLPAANDTDKILKEAADKVFGLKPAPGVFQELSKGQRVGNYLEAEAGSVSNPTVAETARGFAKQTLEKVKFNNVRNPELTLGFEQDVTADIKKADEKAPVVPAAAAFALNRDPWAFEWGESEFTLTLRDLLTDPSTPRDISLRAQATPGTASAALYGVDVAFSNFDDPEDLPSDLTTLEDTARGLFSLSMFLSNDGGSISRFIDLTLGSGATIRDNFNDSSLATVLARLNAVTEIRDGVLGFNSDTPFFAFTVGIPGAPLGSVLFTRDFGGAAANAAVAEPTALLLVGSTILGLLARRVRRVGALAP
jgi:hypothetical protein